MPKLELKIKKPFITDEGIKINKPKDSYYVIQPEPIGKDKVLIKHKGSFLTVKKSLFK